MLVKDTAKKQAVDLLDRAAKQLRGLPRPQAGWLAVVRHALGISGAQVAARMGVSRNAIHQAERNEREEAITIAQMKKIAEAMDAEFVYAVIPKGSVEAVVQAQAYRIAEKRVLRAGAHMALENQSLSQAQIRRRVQQLADELVRNPPSDFWKS